MKLKNQPLKGNVTECERKIKSCTFTIPPFPKGVFPILLSSFLSSSFLGGKCTLKNMCMYLHMYVHMGGIHCECMYFGRKNSGNSYRKKRRGIEREREREKWKMRLIPNESGIVK